MSLSLARKTLARAAIAVAALLAVLAATSPAAQGQSASEQYEGDGEKATLTFEVDTEGQVPEDATFFGLYGPPASEFSSVQLSDPDGDGTYSAVAGGISGSEIKTGDYVVSIEKGTSDGSERTAIYGPETITVDKDRTVSASYGFSGEDGSNSPDNGEDGKQECIKGMFTRATGTLEKPEATSYQYGTHAITDAQSGCEYALKSTEVSLDEYVGEKVELRGTAVEGYPVDGGPPLLNVSKVEPASGGRSPEPIEKATLTFEVDTEGQVPEDATFFGFYSIVDAYNPLQLNDPDGDGTYSASVELEKGKKYGIKLEKGTGTKERYSAIGGRELTVPGEPKSVLKGPATITLDEDKTVSASYDFSGNGDESPDDPGNGSDDQYDEKERCFLPEGCDTNGNGDDQNDDNNGGNSDRPSSDDGDESSGSGGSDELKVLPDTGGAALLGIGGGALLIGGGLLARRMLR